HHVEREHVARTERGALDGRGQLDLGVVDLGAAAEPRQHEEADDDGDREATDREAMDRKATDREAMDRRAMDRKAMTRETTDGAPAGSDPPIHRNQRTPSHASTRPKPKSS